MNAFEFLVEMAGEIPYENRSVKGQYNRQEMARVILDNERQDWLSTLESE